VGETVERIISECESTIFFPIKITKRDGLPFFLEEAKHTAAGVGVATGPHPRLLAECPATIVTRKPRRVPAPKERVPRSKDCECESQMSPKSAPTASAAGRGWRDTYPAARPLTPTATPPPKSRNPLRTETREGRCKRQRQRSVVLEERGEEGNINDSTYLNAPYLVPTSDPEISTATT
jgi:hypothetical protein